MIQYTNTRATENLILHIFIDDSAAPLSGKTGILYNSAGIKCYYVKRGSTSATQITLANATLGTYTSGGFKEVDATNMPGVYEFHVPNECIAPQFGRSVIKIFGATGMEQTTIVIEELPKLPFCRFTR